MEFHFFFMWFFFLNGLAYVIYALFSRQWRFLVPNKHSFKNAGETLMHDLYIRRKPAPVVKYKVAQQIAYTMIINMGICSLVTGLVMYKPIQFSRLSWMPGGYEAARLEHIILTIGYCLFFVIHILQVICVGWNNFWGMVTGFTVEKDETKS